MPLYDANFNAGTNFANNLGGMRDQYALEKQNRLMQNRYGFSLPQQQSPYESFFNAASKYMGGNGTGTGSTNYYENRLQSLMDNPDSIQNTGAYKFRFDQGQQALERSAAAKGMLNSGNVLAGLAKYGQGMASQAYDDEANRLSSLAINKQNANTQENVGRANSLANLVTAYSRMPRTIIA